MIKEDEILTLEDDKQYYVLDSIIYNNFNYIMISEYDEPNKKLLESSKIMFNNLETNSLEKVVDPKLLFIISSLFAANDETL